MFYHTLQPAYLYLQRVADICRQSYLPHFCVMKGPIFHIYTIHQWSYWIKSILVEWFTTSIQMLEAQTEHFEPLTQVNLDWVYFPFSSFYIFCALSKESFWKIWAGIGSLNPLIGVGLIDRRRVYTVESRSSEYFKVKWDLVKLVMCTLVSRDCVPFCKNI